MCSIPKIKYSIIVFPAVDCDCFDKREDFWSEVWDFYELIGEKGSTPYLSPYNNMPGSKFFPDGTIIYAENILMRLQSY